MRVGEFLGCVDGKCCESITPWRRSPGTRQKQLKKRKEKQKRKDRRQKIWNLDTIVLRLSEPLRGRFCGRRPKKMRNVPLRRQWMSVPQGGGAKRRHREQARRQDASWFGGFASPRTRARPRLPRDGARAGGSAVAERGGRAGQRRSRSAS